MAGRSVSGRWCLHATRIAQRLRHHDWLAALLDLLIVVIGILIALQVSNWNQGRLDVRREHAISSAS